MHHQFGSCTISWRTLPSAPGLVQIIMSLVALCFCQLRIGDIRRTATFEGDVSRWAAEYNWQLWQWHPHEDFYRHIDCEVRRVKLQAMVRGDGASFGGEAGLRYSHRGGWAAWGCSGAGCNRSVDIGTSGCSQRRGETTWYCAIDDPARHGAAAAGIIIGNHRCIDTLGKAGDGVQGKVYVQCPSDLGRAFWDKARGLWRCWNLRFQNRPEGEGLQSLFWTILVGCDNDFGKDDQWGARVLPPGQNTGEWRLAVPSWVDDGQERDGNTHARWDCDQVGREGGHHQAWDLAGTGSPTVRERKRQRTSKRQKQEEQEWSWEWRGSGSQGQTNLFLLPYGRVSGLELPEHETRWSSHHQGKHWNLSHGWYTYCRQGSGGDNRKLLGDRYRQKHSPFEGELILGLCLHLSHLWKSKEVCSVYEIHQAGRAGDSRFRWEGGGQGHRTWGRMIEFSPAWKSWAWSCCEGCSACGRGTQLSLPIKASG